MTTYDRCRCLVLTLLLVPLLPRHLTAPLLLLLLILGVHHGSCRVVVRVRHCDGWEDGGRNFWRKKSSGGNDPHGQYRPACRDGVFAVPKLYGDYDLETRLARGLAGPEYDLYIMTESC